ncbi:hypothetical protein CC86DRAFT_401675 [Ophiobolus disseminans]|uniref:F-box domain-containing protein n=1 Tax=Ophiobolus disseminans TaxID=1469910 RepID=A0A6A7ACS2_9PLEO|nr:hypothetical protein CC86DRAFT_401675 [Ophiobolus disseminans]
MSAYTSDTPSDIATDSESEDFARPSLAASSPSAETVTPRGPKVLLGLPTEILDQILFRLTEGDWRNLRATNTIFENSAQALIYHEVEFWDSRPFQRDSSDQYIDPYTCQLSTGEGIRNIEGFCRLLFEQPTIRRCVRALRLRLLVERLRRDDITAFVPRVLEVLQGLKNVKKLTLCFGELRFASHLRERVYKALSEGLLRFPLTEVAIENPDCQDSTIDELRSLPITSVKVIGGTSLGERDIYIDTLQQLPLLTHLQFWGGVGDKEIRHICTALQAVNSLSIGVHSTHRLLNQQTIAALAPANSRLVALRLTRQSWDDAGKFGGPADLHSFTALRRLEIDSTFMITSRLCESPPPSSSSRTRESNRLYGLDFWVQLQSAGKLRDIMPPQLKELTLFFNGRHCALPRDAQGIPRRPKKKEFEWLHDWLEGAAQEFCWVNLVEKGDGCQDGPAGQEEWRLNDKERSALQLKRFEMRIWVQKGGWA